MADQTPAAGAVLNRQAAMQVLRSQTVMHLAPITPRPTHRSLVLIADDEQAIQRFLGVVLSRLGFAVLPVSDGEAAVAAVELHADQLLCVILDVVMPVMNGVDAAYLIRQRAPNLPIALMSGAIPDSYIERMAQIQLVGLLIKPFSFAALREVIHRAAQHYPADTHRSI